MTKMENITTYIQSILIYGIHKSSYKSREKYEHLNKKKIYMGNIKTLGNIIIQLAY